MRVFVLTFVLCVALVGKSFAAEVVVLSVDGVDSLRTGMVLSLDEDVQIPKNSHVIIITARGLKVKIEGPFSGALATQLNEGETSSGSVNLVNAFAKLFNSRAFSTKAVGAFRSLSAPALSDPWAFDVQKGGTVCFAKTQDLKLWRSKAGQTDAVSLSRGEAMVFFELPKDQAFVSWPSDAPLKDTSQYELTLGDNKAIPIDLRAVPGDMPTRMHAAAWMAEQGCDDQATLLIVNADIDKLLQGLAQSGKF